MTKQFNLSENGKLRTDGFFDFHEVYVKEFIKKLKEGIKSGRTYGAIDFHDWIDKLAGDKLI